MATNTADDQGFESALKETELGSFLSDNKGLIITLVIGVLIGVLSYGAYVSMGEKSEKNAANAYYIYEKSTLDNFKKGTLSATELVGKFEAVGKEFASKNAIFTSSLMTFDALFEKKNYKEAQTILSTLSAKNNYQTFLLSLRKAAVLEETGEVDGAIAELELIKATGLKVMEGKVYLDLGRLQLKKGQKDLAKKSFEMVGKVKAQAIFKSLAQYYLQQM